MTCDLCHKRRPVKDPVVLGITGFKPNVFVCDECLEWHKQNQEMRKE